MDMPYYVDGDTEEEIGATVDVSLYTDGDAEDAEEKIGAPVDISLYADGNTE